MTKKERQKLLQRKWRYKKKLKSLNKALIWQNQNLGYITKELKDEIKDYGKVIFNIEEILKNRN